MAEPFAAWELARKSCENTEQDIDEICRSKQRILGRKEARGFTSPFAVVFLSGDDHGDFAEGVNKRRPRQNVLWEPASLIGMLGRRHVCAPHERPVEIPSDYYGVAFVRFDESDAWKIDVRRELEAVGRSCNDLKLCHPFYATGGQN